MRVHVLQVLKSKPRLAAFSGFQGSQTALHRAIKTGQQDVCNIILDACREYSETQRRKGVAFKDTLLGIVTNQRTSKGLTPLMLACEGGQDGIVKLLLDAGADPLAIDLFHCRTCLHYASIGGHPSCVKLLLSDEVQINAKGRHCYLRDYVSDDLQVQSAKYIDQRSFGGLTALHFAAVAGNLECVQLLLKFGAATMVRTDGEAFIGDDYLTPGSSPLHVAVLVGNMAVAHAILQAHAELMSAAGPATGDRRRRPWEGHSRTDIRSVRNAHRRLAFHLARERGMRSMQLLVDPRINVDVALDQVRDAQQGLGAKRLSSICSHVLQKHLLAWLDEYEATKDCSDTQSEEIIASKMTSKANMRKLLEKNDSAEVASKSWLGIMSTRKSPNRELLDLSAHTTHARHATADADFFSDSGTATETQFGIHRVRSDGHLGSGDMLKINFPNYDEDEGKREITEGAKQRRGILPGFMTSKSKSNLQELEQQYSHSSLVDSDSMGSCSHVDDQVDSTLYNRECGICLDARVDVAFHGCGHELCIDCARNLTMQDKKPPNCPFCRKLVVGFLAVSSIAHA